MKNGKLTVAIVGMGFGSCFLPIYHCLCYTFK